jgi:hypothetical protein
MSLKLRVEASHQPFVLGLLVYLESSHRVRSNRQGRSACADILDTPRAPGAGAVLKVKVMEPDFGDTVESCLREAIAHLVDRDCAAEVHEHVVVFDGKRCWVRVVMMTRYDLSVFPDPDDFRPEWFIDRRYSLTEFMPFGGGAPPLRRRRSRQFRTPAGAHYADLRA